MRSHSRNIVQHCLVAACVALIASGCVLDRSPILPGWGQVQPAEYCSGDTLRASYDLLGSEACPAGVDCTPYLPNVAISSTPALFPASSLRSYRDGVDFTASGDSVAVTFDIDRGEVLIPTDRFEGGARVFLQRTGLTDITSTARRIVGAREFPLTHGGMCSGSTPAHASVELPGAPQLSPNLRLTQLCNASGVAIRVIISGGASGIEYTQELLPGDCLDTGMPGVPGDIAASRLVSVAPLFPDPSTRCSATGPNNPPPTLRTVARMACP